MAKSERSPSMKTDIAESCRSYTDTRVTGAFLGHPANAMRDAMLFAPSTWGRPFSIALNSSRPQVRP